MHLRVRTRSMGWDFNGRLGTWVWRSGAVRRVCTTGAGRLEFRVALPALAPQHGTVERWMRLESEVMAPACHQKKIPPPGNTSRAGALITILACRVGALLACVLYEKRVRYIYVRTQLSQHGARGRKSCSPHESVAAAVSASVTAARISEG